MYASLNGLSEMPFSITPDPKFFFHSPNHREAIACLRYVAAEKNSTMVLAASTERPVFAAFARKACDVMHWDRRPSTREYSSMNAA